MNDETILDEKKEQPVAMNEGWDMNDETETNAAETEKRVHARMAVAVAEAKVRGLHISSLSADLELSENRSRASKT